MAKNGTTKWVSIGITVLVFVAGIAGTFALHGRDIADLKGNGCSPARAHTTQIAVLQTELREIKENQKEQKEDTKTIIRILEDRKSTQAIEIMPKTSSPAAQKI